MNGISVKYLTPQNNFLEDTGQQMCNFKKMIVRNKTGYGPNVYCVLTYHKDNILYHKIILFYLCWAQKLL